LDCEEERELQSRLRRTAGDDMKKMKIDKLSELGTGAEKYKAGAIAR